VNKSLASNEKPNLSLLALIAAEIGSVNKSADVNLTTLNLGGTDKADLLLRAVPFRIVVDGHAEKAVDCFLRCGAALSLHARSLNIPDSANPNKLPFSGVLTKIDVPSDSPPEGSNGRRILGNVTRLKGGVPTTHPLDGPTLRALRQLYKAGDNAFVFLSERGGPMAREAFQRLVERAGKAAGLDFAVHPHMLRHACGYRLANEGKDAFGIQGWLGHQSLGMTKEYVALSADRFKDW
jgi:hypothetical protein